MKVENIQLVKNIPDKPLPQLLSQGDFVMSEVIKVEDGTALLRTAQGTLLSARLLGELALKAGDHVETVVDEAGQGRYVLRLLDIAPGKTVAPEAGQAGEAATQSLKSQTLYSTLNILKKNAGLEPKAAEFMARNGIAATPENIGTLTRLTGGGQRVAQALTQMMADAALVTTGVERATTDAGNQPVSAGTAETLTAGQGGYAVPGAARQNAAMQAPANTTTTTALMPMAVSVPDNASSTVFPGTAETSGPDQLPREAIEPTPAALSRPEAAPQNGMPVSKPELAPLNGAQTLRPDDSPPHGMETLRPDNAVSTVGSSREAAADGDQEPVALLKRLVSLFAGLKDKDALPAQLKQAAHELPVQLKELKNSLQNADNMDRNTLGQRAELLDRQFSMMADIKRFDCYHVPLMNANGNPSTAELYIYRQRRRKAEEAPDSYAVLIGLDTQHMGRVETMVRAQGRSVVLEFRLEQASLAGMFEAAAEHLAPLISQAGYRLGDVSVRELETKTTVLTAEEVLAEGQPADIDGLDIRI